MPSPNPKDAQVPEEPVPFAIGTLPEEEFWERYNRRLEFPLAAVAAVLLHVIVFVVLVFGLLSLMSGTQTPDPKLELVEVAGWDPSGLGSAGSGGNPDPNIIKDVSPEQALRDVLPTPQAIAEAKEKIQKIVLDDPSENIPISPQNLGKYSQLDDELRKKLLGNGSQKGSGPGAGRGDSGDPGAGPGGTNADSTRARGLRWVLRFQVANGRDYLEQLRAMGAEILVPLPPNDKESILFPDLNKPSQKRTATDDDFRRLARKIQFGDTRRDAVVGVVGALGLDVTPKTFFAFFPKELEEQLARLETGFKGRRSEHIEETIFRVTVRGGRHEFVVEEQTAKR
ncbi:hypothetical protein GobsT_59350 [Gemmata obscuriglobus]|uniref:Uncharacterized protein n=1 Tax=Gemmata obscuriglobus TaxID=114 RepID=A0A2Z3H5P4_9BACT|nr:hypothetical protein [Gemmata obscuriglobus]AWM36280.1 hypothetical protein C1280_04125 [Gemmata obscuriglobus]QEG31114.1 hypothetical protein GobsT_59350 [Gemmata obscuriglobus]VTS10451.1 Uncharacterized protein OS=Planctomyces maris DSM 8797 GN=PM8797T_27085 PE=4 SV=1 [Gemmata obscuriglobus UQM 2246]